MAGEDTGSEEANGYRHARGPIDDQGADPGAPACQRSVTLAWQAQALAWVSFAGRGQIRRIVRHLAEATRLAQCAAACRRSRLCYTRETFVQLDRNRISIRLSEQPRADPIRTRSACLLSVELAQWLRVEQDVHLRASSA